MSLMRQVTFCLVMDVQSVTDGKMTTIPGQMVSRLECHISIS